MKRKLELTWIGKENRPKVAQRCPRFATFTRWLTESIVGA